MAEEKTLCGEQRTKEYILSSLSTRALNATPTIDWPWKAIWRTKVPIRWLDLGDCSLGRIIY